MVKKKGLKVKLTENGSLFLLAFGRHLQPHPVIDTPTKCWHITLLNIYSSLSKGDK